MIDTVSPVVPILALIVSLASFGFAWLADVRSQKAEAIRNLLGEKESVSFGALKLLRDGFPQSKRDRQLLIGALMQACVFEGSDRARALLYRVIEKNRTFQADFDQALTAVDETHRSMARYAFSKRELDLSNGELQVAAVRKVLRQEVAYTG